MSDSGGSIFGEGGLLGSKFSIITKWNYRYEGILQGGNSRDNTIAFAAVRSFGTDDRWRTDPDPAIMSKGSIDFINNIGSLIPKDIVKVQDLTFHRHLIKDIRVLESPKPQQIDANASSKNLTFQLSQDLANYCCSKELSDIQIKCQDKTFDAHQLILSARSPVFKKMLESDMVEKKRKVIIIKLINSDIVKEMLKFIYTGTGECVVNDANVDPQTVKQLFEAANMYQLDSLKAFCVDSLTSTLVPDNALSLLLLGDMHSAEKLKKHALSMVVNNLKTIRRSDEWKMFMKERPDISADIIEAMADKLEA